MDLWDHVILGIKMIVNNTVLVFLSKDLHAMRYIDFNSQKKELTYTGSVFCIDGQVELHDQALDLDKKNWSIYEMIDRLLGAAHQDNTVNWDW